VNRRRLILGTRGSKLALRQAHLAAGALRREAPDLELEVQTVTTRGDGQRDAPPASLGGAGVFVKKLEAALLDGRIDLAVHSMKDLPSQMSDGLVIAAVPRREDPRDALLAREAASLATLPRGARVGTSSPRRRAQLLHLGPALDVCELRGNLDTRLRRLAEGRYDAIVLAAAGLRRLHLEHHITELLPFETMLPAVGQGALAIQTRADAQALRARLAALDHPESRAAVTAERAFLRRVAGGCHVPVAAHASVTNGDLTIAGCIASPDGVGRVRGRAAGLAWDAESLGLELAERLLDEGGHALLAAVTVSA
jgi:hydroxymethylbilane synthase